MTSTGPAGVSDALRVDVSAKTRAARGSARPSPRLLVCVALLAFAAIGVQVLPEYFGVFFRKEALPLKRELAYFDLAHLGPRYVRSADSDELVMTEDMIDTLGTRQYFQAYLTDTAVPENDPARVAHLFLTYYTGKPDQVPHVPDECYLAGGYDPMDTASANVKVVGVGAPNDEVPVRIVQFVTSKELRVTGERPHIVSVLYLFHTNGTYATTRDEVRWAQADFWQRYAYYAKIEITFPRTRSLDSTQSQAVSIKALAPLLQAVLPVLLDEHIDLARFHAAPAARPAQR